MVHRQPRRYSNTPEELERIAREACPNCGREREHFNLWNMDAVCCRPSCSAEYWGRQPTIAEMRRRIHDEQEGKCAHCGQEIRMLEGGPDAYIMDHIRPIAMAGDQWARENLQVLCRRCNRLKTARDMGRIARWKKYHLRGLARPDDPTRQLPLLAEAAADEAASCGIS